LPTAQQSDADTHVTPEMTLACVLLTFGELTAAHDVPFQRSVRVCWTRPVDPTVQHSDAVTQVTPDRALSSPTAGLGAATMVHTTPFQRSTRVW
jgi:hypothetical protein